jgi:signal transduction histidine kinase
VAVAIVSSLSVPFSAWIFTGGIPYIVLTNTPLRLANVVLVALVIGIRERLGRLHEAEAEARATEERRARSAAEAEEQARFSRFIHDEVLSVLTAAQFFTGAPPAELREEAGATIRALAMESPPGRIGSGRQDPAPLAERLRARLARIAPAAAIAIETDDHPVETEPVEALAEAAAEALRNATRYARAQRVSVRGRIADGAVELTVSDDGAGFDPSAVPPERLGVRESIVARVTEIGGRASIVSAPGAGTEVRLSWAP